MCHKQSQSLTAKYQTQSGSALVIGIFILVVMLLLGTALTRTLNKSADSIAYEVLGTRAYQAANIGVQHRLATIFPLDSASQYCAGGDITGADPGDVLNDPNYLTSIEGVDGLRNCRVTQVSCVDFKVNDVVYYRIRSTGECDIDGTQTSRTVEVEARSL
ncbi:MSHA biogenesis protein MshP [Thalassotalea sp. M1531]|uniref:MSHA biogenesis protein MshP n=1 Tax=Thalassotalea algicola TaxID=2716224 RepID=A0A7Y0LE10_9GAMM|nr:pilus assembly PilX N-terminal domain-containing protein [Thalassotalea algicola]NMP31936.1 MSHA biogenesis protein MshP [Thalassotalea algicola]